MLKDKQAKGIAVGQQVIHDHRKLATQVAQKLPLKPQTIIQPMKWRAEPNLATSTICRGSSRNSTKLGVVCSTASLGQGLLHVSKELQWQQQQQQRHVTASLNGNTGSMPSEGGGQQADCKITRYSKSGLCTRCQALHAATPAALCGMAFVKAPLSLDVLSFSQPATLSIISPLALFRNTSIKPALGCYLPPSLIALPYLQLLVLLVLDDSGISIVGEVGGPAHKGGVVGGHRQQLNAALDGGRLVRGLGVQHLVAHKVLHKRGESVMCVKNVLFCAQEIGVRASWVNVVLQCC